MAMNIQQFKSVQLQQCVGKYYFKALNFSRVIVVKAFNSACTCQFDYCNKPIVNQE